ncbi:ester cyclase [Parasulfitobacter algicola]|uniref:Ester cyclase n=1 Tax=Parasulfitobacter algicola TaxID=2614809 RepID=A0ABX2IVU0_9RHOB|nr:ester cyclase [Sulfitobacter algicola]NSX57049.1 ester cyclase [Sulfitobacter algicola]
MHFYKDLCDLGNLFAVIASSGDATRFADLVAPSYINHNPYVEQGLEGVIGFFGHFMSAVPDLTVTAQSVIADVETQTVIGRYTYSGTHDGPFMGYAATGSAISMRSIDIWRVKNGKFVEHWDELNTLDLFQQIGAAQMLPATAA